MTEAMTRYQLNVHANGSNSGENHYDNPFGRPPRTERVPVREHQHIPAKEEPKWEINFKAELPEFHGSLNPDEFTDWIHTDERVFDYQDEVKLQEQFLPFNSTQSLYKRLHNLRQTGSVEEYAESFYQLIARVDLNECEKQLVARFISGLKIHIQDVLCLHTCWTVSEAFNRALLIEKQKSRRVQSYPFTSRNGGTTPNLTESWSWSQPAKKMEMGSNMASTSNAASHTSKAAAKNQTGVVFKCFKCGEAGHKAADCKKPMLSQGKTLMIDDCEDQEDDNQPVYDMETGEEIRGDEHEEEGMALMMKKTLLAPEKEEEKDWVRSSIFHNSCNIGGKVCNLIIDVIM